MSESQLVACVPCGILVAFCGPSEAQLGPPSVRDGPGTSPRSKLQAHLIADNDDCSAAQSGTPPKPAPTSKNIKETTDQNATAHCSVPMLKCPGDEARSSSRWCGAELATPHTHTRARARARARTHAQCVAGSAFARISSRFGRPGVLVC